MTVLEAVRPRHLVTRTIERQSPGPRVGETDGYEPSVCRLTCGARLVRARDPGHGSSGFSVKA
jgi:hypothetical protein